MAARGTFDSKRAQARKLFDEGLSCNAIAKRLKCSPSTVSRWAKAEGLSFKDRAQTATATAVREFDMAAARIRLAEKMTKNADKVQDSLDGPFLVYSFGGKDNTYREHTLEVAPMSARREAQPVTAIPFDKLTKALEAVDEANGLAPVESMLGRLAMRFGLVESASDDA